MKLVINVPPSYREEREYIIKILLETFLGLDYHIQVREITHTEICMETEKRLILPDVLFKSPKTKWLTAESLPKQPLERVNCGYSSFDLNLISRNLPVIYGETQKESGRLFRKIPNGGLGLTIDILGSSFFMLTRYEEIVKADRDEYDRFPATASLAHQEGFLERPIVDEYVEILWAAMSWLWPSLKRKNKTFSIQVSHDVDWPSRYGFLSLPQIIRAMAGDIFMRGNVWNAAFGPFIRLTRGKNIHPSDPYNTYDYIMNVSEQHGIASSFYFICGHSPKNFTVHYEIEHPAIRHLLRRIHERGHEIGLHPSYDTYNRPQEIVLEADHLRQVCKGEGIEQAQWGGRMHYLRWETPTTLYGLEQAGMSYDSTMTYADYAGFRCGTCHEYQAFDPVSKRKFSLHVRPLIAMEGTVLGKKYMGLSVADAYEKFVKLKQACRSVNGAFTLLWHNDWLTTEHERKLYEMVIEA